MIFKWIYVGAAQAQRERSAPAAHRQRGRSADGTNIQTPVICVHNENPSLVALGKNGSLVLHAFPTFVLEK